MLKAKLMLLDISAPISDVVPPKSKSRAIKRVWPEIWRWHIGMQGPPAETPISWKPGWCHFFCRFKFCWDFHHAYLTLKGTWENILLKIERSIGKRSVKKNDARSRSWKRKKKLHITIVVMPHPVPTSHHLHHLPRHHHWHLQVHQTRHR